MQPDDRITLTGQTTFYQNQGLIQILVESIEEAPGTSAYMKKVEAEKAAWESDGAPHQEPLFTRNPDGTLQTCRLPIQIKEGKTNPIRMAVITADHAMGYEDFKSSIHSTDFLLTPFHAKSLKPEEIIPFLQEVDQPEQFDLIGIVRGGGDRYGLLPFSDAGLARAIAATHLPIATGIGHEPNLFLADQAASHHSITPTGLAEDLNKLYAQKKRAEIAKQPLPEPKDYDKKSYTQSMSYGELYREYIRLKRLAENQEEQINTLKDRINALENQSGLVSKIKHFFKPF